MRKYQKYGVYVLLSLGMTACTSHYKLTGIRYSRIQIDSRFDTYPDKEATEFLRPYKAKVDSIMTPVVGKIAHDMDAKRPESNLSNLLSDILVWAGKHYGEHPDVGIYNVGGIRASLVKGDVTYGDILDVAPFENKICFLTLTGADLKDLFRQIAARGGEGVNHGVNMIISKDHQLLDVHLNGQEILPEKTYRIATLDYLAQGNDGLVAFKKGTQVVAPQETQSNLRYIIMDFFKEKAAKGEAVSAKVEGRVVVK